MIYIKWSILFFLFPFFSPPGPQRQTQTLRKCSAHLDRHYLHCKKLSYKAQCLSGGKKQMLSHSSGPSLIVPYKSLYFVRATTLLIKRLIFLFLLHNCHVGMWKPWLLNRTQCEFYPSEQCCYGIFMSLKCLKIKHNTVFFHRQEDSNKIQMN